MGRGSSREALKNFSGAAEDYLEAVKLQPKSPEANLRLGLVFVTMKKNALGRRYLERTVELDPGGDAGSKAQAPPRDDSGFLSAAVPAQTGEPRSSASRRTMRPAVTLVFGIIETAAPSHPGSP